MSVPVAPAPVPTPAPTVLELFAGAGGASLGLHEASFHALARVEWAPPEKCKPSRKYPAGLRPSAQTAAGSLRAAQADGGPLAPRPGHAPAVLLNEDAHRVDLSGFAGQVDLLWASPPCQPWSTAGSRLGEEDERDGWPAVLRAVDIVHPVYLLCENVPGLADKRGRPYLEGYLLPELRRRFAWVDWKILDAADFGVPQRRRRVFIAAGPGPMAWPVPTRAGGRCGMPWAWPSGSRRQKRVSTRVAVAPSNRAPTRQVLPCVPKKALAYRLWGLLPPPKFWAVGAIPMGRPIPSVGPCGTSPTSPAR